MGDLSPRLSRHEFACECGCGLDTADYQLINILEATADHFERELNASRVLIHILSGCRCHPHNERVQKQFNPDYTPNTSVSQHMYSRAVDAYMEYDQPGAPRRPIPPKQITAHLDTSYPDKFGIGLYTNRFHFDTRTDGPARWDLSGKRE